MAFTDYFNLNMRQSPMLHAQLDGSTTRQVKNAPFFIGTTVGNPHVQMFSVVHIDDPHHTPKRHRSMGGRQSFHVEDLSIRSLPPVELLAIPRSNPPVLDAHIKLRIALRDPSTGPQRETDGDCHWSTEE